MPKWQPMKRERSEEVKDFNWTRRKKDSHTWQCGTKHGS